MLVDSHFHLSWTARSKIDLNLRDAKDINEVYSKVKAEAEKGGTYSGWIVGTLLPIRLAKLIDRDLLDEASPTLPVSLATRDGHMAVVNSKALEMGKLDCRVEGVECEGGRPTGRIYEEAMRRLRKVMPDPDVRALFRAFKEVLDELREGGVRQVHSMSSRWLEIKLVEELNHEVEVYHYTPSGGPLEGAVGVKLFADGVIVHGTARTDGRGKLYLSAAELASWLRKAKSEGFQVAVHVMGDEALDMVMSAFRKAEVPSRVLRIEHAALVRDDQLEPLAELGVPVTVQPGIMEAVGVEEFKKLLGNKWKMFMRVKDFLEHRIKVYGGSDHPVGPWRLEEIKRYYRELWRPPTEEEIMRLHTTGWELVGMIGPERQMGEEIGLW
ncbi:MAG: amidohydrolase family protein [Crenarchaeota archaeon]|nr:amidohydrolase family protein [Thermoproteota archaeon]